MENPLNQIISSFRIVLGKSNYFLAFLILTAIIFWVLFGLQLKTVPGNSFQLQVKIFGLKDWLILGFVSILNSLFIVMQIYTRKLKIKVESKSVFAFSGVNIFSSLTSSIFGTATCSLCVGAVFGFLGANTVLFLVNNKNIITIVTIGILSISLYLSSKRFNSLCRECRVNS